VLGADGSAASLIRATHSEQLIRMDGHETFIRAVGALTSSTHGAAKAAGVELDDIDLFVYHQANGRILTAVREALELASDRVVDVIAEVGNTSAASIPLALAHARDGGLLRPGARVLIGAMGAGFTYGAAVLRWGSA
jgi:3-oxoacyl-[acyl-carrier-protein] synthase-3